MLSRRTIVAAGLASALPLSSRGDTLEAPKGQVILTVTGAISRTNAARTARLDLAQLDAIDRSGFTTGTPWHNEKVSFEGVRGDALLKALGASGTEVIATALNDYAAALPIDDFLKHKLLIANRVNGKTMTVREKGPLWIVYPYDSAPDLNTGVFHGRSVWQLAKLEVR
ncbi:MAG: molybdopterin-dependent oxidoreductase [Alphaproteobacteria bacterium]|nr:molybdopterin-dependent oxidoreductase [Alphaproteobacteria bacterium]